MPRPITSEDKFIFSISYRDPERYIQNLHYSFDEFKAMEWCMRRTGDGERYSSEPVWRFIVRKHLADDAGAAEYSKIVCLFNQAGNTVDIEDSGEVDEVWIEQVEEQ